MTLAPPAGLRPAHDRAPRDTKGPPRRVLLVATEGTHVDRAPRPPLELAAIGAVLRGLGAQVELVDRRLAHRPASDLTERAPDAVFLWGEDTRALVGLARELRIVLAGVELIAGGPGLDPDLLLGGRAVDLVVLDGDAQAVDLWYRRRLAGDDRAAGCRGLAWRTDGGAVVREPALAPPAQADALPTPAWDLVELARYARKGRSSAPLVTGRSCGPRCEVCHHSFGHSFRARSLSKVLAEVDQLASRGVRELVLEDDPFNLDPARATALLRGLLARGHGLELRLAHPLRADRIDGDLAQALADSGLRRVELWLESASPRTQRETRLNLRFDAARRGIELLAAAGVRTRGRFTLGRPGETPAEHRATVAWARRSELDTVDFRGGAGRRRAWLGFHLNAERVARRLRSLLQRR